MSFNKHSELKGLHALFSPSQSSWLRYDENKIAERIINRFRAPLGTEMHEFAASQIELGHKISSIRNLPNEISNYIYCKYKYLNPPEYEITDYGVKLINYLDYIPKEIFEIIKCYVNDAIGFKMTVEQPLLYSENIFGTADAICFRDNLLRIHDLKTGSTTAHMEQLETYAALYCLEYGVKSEIDIELRLYQWDGIIVHNPSFDEIKEIQEQIIFVEKVANKVRKGN